MKKGNKDNLRMKFCCENWKTKEYVHLNIFHDKTIDLLPRQRNKQRGSFFFVFLFWVPTIVQKISRFADLKLVE